MRSFVEHSLTLDLPSLMRRGRVRDGNEGEGRLFFTEVDGSRLGVAFLYDLTDPRLGYLALKYVRVSPEGGRREIMQFIRMTFTVPHFGGRRWWMICDGQRVAKVYLPRCGNSFGTREAWRLAYRSQHDDPLCRAIARAARLERTLEEQQRRRVKAGSTRGTRRDTDIRANCAAVMKSMLRIDKDRYG